MHRLSSESLFVQHPGNLQRPLPANMPKMCTPWTLRKLTLRHHLRDGHRNLSKSRFQQEDDSNRSVFPTTQPSHDNDHQQGQSNTAQQSPSSSSPGKGRTTTTALVTRYDYSRNSEAPSRVAVVKRGKHKRRVTIGSNQTSTSASSLGGGVGGVEEADWPPFTDEDYIVFCFEEDGDFHVVTEENSKSQDCSEHRPFNQKSQGDDEGDLASAGVYNNDNMDGNQMNRRDCLLPHKAVEEELFYFSPRLQSDGIKSLTRFKEEVDNEDARIVKARGRVDEVMHYEDIDGIKNRGQYNEDKEDVLLCEDVLEFHKISMECRDGSVESTESSQSDWERQLHLTENIQEAGLPSSQAQEDPSSSQKGKLKSPSYTQEILLSSRMADDEDSVYLSSESQQGGNQGDRESARVSAEITISQSEAGTVQLEEDEDATLDSDSAKSECSISSTSSFEFPVLQWEWIGSPVKWPKSKTSSLRKLKSRQVCLRCCRF